MASRKVEIEREGRVAVLTLNSPERRNAIDLEMKDQLVEAVRACERDPVTGAIVITGAGRAFCAGAVLGSIEAAGRDGYRAIYESFMCIARSPLPTVAAINGVAVGAGMNLALACDVRIAAASSAFICRFADIGLHPGGGHIWMLNRAVGAEAAMAMVMFGQELDGREAAARGLAYSCVEDGDELGVAIKLASRAAEAPGELIARIKETFAAAPGTVRHEDALEAELETQHWSSQQPFHLERIQALKAKIGIR